MLVSYEPEMFVLSPVAPKGSESRKDVTECRYMVILRMICYHIAILGTIDQNNIENRTSISCGAGQYAGLVRMRRQEPCVYYRTEKTLRNVIKSRIFIFSWSLRSLNVLVCCCCWFGERKLLEQCFHGLKSRNILSRKNIILLFRILVNACKCRLSEGEGCFYRLNTVANYPPTPLEQC